MHAVTRKARILFVGGICCLVFCLTGRSQPITGIWRGKMGAFRVELKLVRKGDSLLGTSYYYNSKNDYRRYTVKGYFDDRAMDVVWWDDVLLENHSSRRMTGADAEARMAVAEFNCPGEGIMKLDGKSSLRDQEQRGARDLHLVKGPDDPVFPDEWDFVMTNYAYSVSHPGIIDSVEQIALSPQPVPQGYEESPLPALARAEPVSGKSIPEPAVSETSEKKLLPAAPLAQTNEQKFNSRIKILQTVIPVKGDSVELRFYDNAEIDGDSIAVFLNGQLLREHILLSDRAYSFKIAVQELRSDNELVMVAENLGTIPPNTSLMVAVVGDKQYEAHLQSTEGSSALVRLLKP